MAWYDTGTVSVTNGSTTVTGSGTNFVSGAQIGEAFYGPDDSLYEIEAIVSATELTLADAYLGSTQSGQNYKIIPTQSLVADLAGQVTTLINDFQTVADEAGEGKFDDGSAASPGITFTQDQDTGLFRETANEIGIAVGGSKIGEFNSTGLNGTVIGGTTPAAISGTTGTLSKLTVDPEDDGGAGVLINNSSSGTSSNWGLEIGPYTRVNQSDLVFNANAVIGSQDSLNFVAETGGVFTWRVGGSSHKTGEAGSSEVLRIDSSGNVGIGTNNPSEKLDVVGDVEITGQVKGTAVTQSATDTTSGRLLKVRDFGVGGTYAIGSSDDYNTDLPNVGMFVGNPSTSPANAPVGTGASGFQSFAASTRGSRLLINSQGSGGAKTSNDLWFQGYDSGWADWSKVYHDGNILGTVSESSGTPTGAIIERGSNANGEYVKFADGTMICTHSLDATYDASGRQLEASWGYPASFSSVPSAYSAHAGSAAAATPTNDEIGQIFVANRGTSFVRFDPTRISGGADFQSGDTMTLYVMAVGRWY